MPVVFVPPNIVWVNTPDPTFTGGGWDLDKAKYVLRGPRSSKATNEAAMVRFQPMPGFGAMYLESWESVITSPNFPSIVGSYIGTRTGIMPPAKGTASLSSQVARATGTDPSSGNKFSAEVIYRASRTTWEWYQNSSPSPKTPLYGPLISTVSPFQQIDRISVTDDSGNTTIPASELTAVFNALIPTIVMTEYDPEPVVPNAIWKCKSVFDYKFTST